MVDIQAASIRHELVLNTVWSMFPAEVGACLARIPGDTLARVEELRFRVNQPIQLCGAKTDLYLTNNASGCTVKATEGIPASQSLINQIMQTATQASLYAVGDELRRGYVTVPGGHRIGIAGRVAVSEAGTVKSIRTISSLNVRIARQFLGVADAAKRYLFHATDGRPVSVLILSPPGCGKTTLLRDLSRQWSVGTISAQSPACKVTVVDERSEISGCIDGVPQFELGPRTDVLDGCPKAEGMMMAIRTLSPDIVVTDEIGRSADVQAVLEAVNAGVAVVTSAHASSLDEWRQRPHMEDLLQAKAFYRYVLLSRRKGPCTVERIFDTHGRPIA